MNPESNGNITTTNPNQTQTFANILRYNLCVGFPELIDFLPHISSDPESQSFCIDF